MKCILSATAIVLILSGPLYAASVDLPIKATIIRCVTCQEATAMCQQGVSVCCPVKERECRE